MGPNLWTTTPIPLLEQWLAFSEARHTVLAGNIANLDTPEYRTQDLSVSRFQELLREALQAPVHPPYQSPGQLPKNLATREAKLREVNQRLTSLLRHDGTNVGLEQQIAEITKNQMMHNLVVSIMNSQFRLLQAAISERV